MEKPGRPHFITMIIIAYVYIHIYIYFHNIFHTYNYIGYIYAIIMQLAIIFILCILIYAHAMPPFCQLMCI